MTKKKNSRQKHQKAVSFADTSDEELNVNVQGKSCQHVARGIHFGRVKKTLKSTQSTLTCNGCPEEEIEDPPEVWLCLQCGYRGCGRTSQNKHGLQHFKTLHSDCHSLVLSTTSGAVWCYECDDEISLQCSHILKQCVEFVMKTTPNSSSKTNISGGNKVVTQSLQDSVIKEETTGQNFEKADSAIKIPKHVKNIKESSEKIPVKGLRNLGNTCFFNAVMQNLNQTTLLYHLLKNTCTPSHLWEVPELNFTESEVTTVKNTEVLKLSLQRQLSLTNSLFNFFEQMCAKSNTKVDIVNPSPLFGEISKKCPQFRHFQQQDSHELLRQLLDGVRQEEIKRQKKAILRYFDLENISPEHVDEEMKKKCKAYGLYASHTIIEKVFGGLLISTILCEECKMSSQIFEPFMDLSLPLFEEKQQENSDQLCGMLDGGKQDNKPLRNRKSDWDLEETNQGEYVITKPKSEPGKPSKHQEKKQKQLAKKEKKKAKNHKNRKNLQNENSDASNNPHPPETVEDEDKDSDDDDEDISAKDRSKEQTERSVIPNLYEDFVERKEAINDKGDSVKHNEDVKYPHIPDNLEQGNEQHHMELKIEHIKDLSKPEEINGSGEGSLNVCSGPVESVFDHENRLLNEEQELKICLDHVNFSIESEGIKENNEKDLKLCLEQVSNVHKSEEIEINDDENLKMYCGQVKEEIELEGELQTGGENNKTYMEQLNYAHKSREIELNGDKNFKTSLSQIKDGMEVDKQMQTVDGTHKNIRVKEVNHAHKAEELEINTYENLKVCINQMKVGTELEEKMQIDDERNKKICFEPLSHDHKQDKLQMNGDINCKISSHTKEEIVPKIQVIADRSSEFIGSSQTNLSLDLFCAEWKKFQEQKDKTDEIDIPESLGIEDIQIDFESYKGEGSGKIQINRKSISDVPDQIKEGHNQTQEFHNSLLTSEPNKSNIDDRIQALTMQIKDVRIRRDSDRQENLLNSSESADENESQRTNCTSPKSSIEDTLSNENEDNWSHSASEQQTKEWILKSLTTLKPRSHILPHECSIDSCLHHFTKPELLTGNNKFRCENCTEMKMKRTGNKKEIVYSNASKQILVFSPPAVLTLHLKRFQQVGMSLRKVNRFVEFPLILDLAPFCSSACVILPHMTSVEDEILYSLYGIVEHSGRLTSGHYTAYVKASRRTINRTFECQVPLGQCNLEQLLHKYSGAGKCFTGNSSSEATEDSCQWFYISDSHVKEVSETQVLKCQAYLLFYERIK